MHRTCPTIKEFLIGLNAWKNGDVSKEDLLDLVYWKEVKWVIELSDKELQIVTGLELDRMEDECMKFDGFFPWIVKGKLVSSSKKLENVELSGKVWESINNTIDQIETYKKPDERQKELAWAIYQKLRLRFDMFNTSWDVRHAVDDPKIKAETIIDSHYYKKLADTFEECRYLLTREFEEKEKKND